ncbi:MAG TPA: zinc ribbon domain-containing protein [Mycobacterium sp.]|mgnify:CR=1 FL=1|nr:MAG: FmdB family transcriptional regulator [Mycobacterium sp.]HOB50991.1 zinc ribbon domain-containing protein [Mycobacterium sp.]HPZ95671.1 zinc ribbon domain-containing protein [Mycobacterium sp.]HQE16357.1 zinc ribbon domain-containing protein [Mycobacterium sp.]
MPTYSYACTACDHKFDAVQAFTDDALTTCPECSGRLRKLFNSVGVVFKGSGFYRTDSRESQKSSASASGGSGSTTGSDKSAPAAASDSGGSSSSSGSSSSAPSSSGSSAPAAAASSS